MIIEEISRNGKIELDVSYSGNTMNFRSEIAQIKNNSILIPGIKANNQTLGFSNKCKVDFLYKSDGKLYIWENVKVKLVKYNGIILHKIDLIGEGKRYNRRENYRVSINEYIPLYINTAAGPSALSVIVKDISETGIGFITTEKFEINRNFHIKLKDNNTLINLSGTFVRRELLSNSTNLYGGKFKEKNYMLCRFIAKRQVS
ncbi:MAG: PilZ domain-containing protein [Herbinix sp.]|nr:PilZ domain-containing protein [Herbinix sp.]